MVEPPYSLSYAPIGVIHSPLRGPAGAPIQSVSGRSVSGTVEVFPPYARGLRGLAGFSHLILIYHFHLADKSSLTVIPFLDNKEHGIFSTRAPVRPNPIGTSIVRLRGVRGRRLYVQDLDVLDGTPLLDIKPYVPRFDSRRAQRIGWYAKRIGKLNQTRADNRFTREDRS